MKSETTKRTRMSRVILRSSFVLLLIGAAGCGSKATVMGKVSYQGRPVVYGSVIMVGSDKKASSGVIEPDGRYRLEGVHPGLVRVAVTSRNPSKARSHQGKNIAGSGKKAIEGWFPLPSRFEDTEKSDLVFTVTKGRN